MLPVIHLLTRAEKQVQLGTLISFLLVGLVPAATWSPLARGGGQLFLFGDFSGNIWSLGNQPEGQVDKGIAVHLGTPS